MGWFFKKKEEPKLLLRRDLVDRAMKETQNVGEHDTPSWYGDPLAVQEFENDLMPIFRTGGVPVPKDEFGRMVFGTILNTAIVAMERAGGTRTDQLRFGFFFCKMVYENRGRSWT